jgi:hypothetical protein
LLGLFSVSPVNADDKGWILTQKSATFGDQYVYISPNGLKCYNPRAGFAFVTHGPDWNITLYNEKTHVYYNTTMDKWRSELETRKLSGDIQNAKWTKGSNTNILGLRAVQYVMNGGNTLRVPHSKNRAAHSVSDANYWVSEDITVPPALASLLSTAYGVPATQNVPLRMTCTDGGAKKTLLETYRSQQAPIPVSYFECPSGFSPVKSGAEVMMNDEEKQILNDLAKDPGSEGAPSAAAQSAYGQATAPAAAAVSTSSAATMAGAAPGGSPNTINVGGLNLDKAKVQKFLENLRKQQQQQQQQ